VIFSRSMTRLFECFVYASVLAAKRAMI
jgi:hypothetical protein